MLMFENDPAKAIFKSNDILSITKDEYADLLVTSEKYDMLVNCFFDNAKLRYGDDLSLSGYDLENIFKVFESRRYKECVKGLLEEKHGTDNKAE